MTDQPTCVGCGATGCVTDQSGHPYHMPVEADGGGFRYASPVCQSCLDRLDADMWVTEAHWRDIGPRVPFDGLPTATTNATGKSTERTSTETKE